VRRASLFVAAISVLVAFVPWAPPASAAPRRPDAPQHVFVIMMENHGFSEIVGNRADAPFTNALLRHAGLATRYFGVTHPSLPNYLAAISGSYQGIFDDCRAGTWVRCAPEEFVPGAGDATEPPAGHRYLKPWQVRRASRTRHMFTSRTIVDQLASAGLTWRAYMQSMPRAGYRGEFFPGDVSTSTGTISVPLYAEKHDPFMYFSRIAAPSSPRAANVVPMQGHFRHDLKTGDVANLVWISPDQCHDMHGMAPDAAAYVGLPACGYPDTGLDHGAIRLGDGFLRRTVQEITRSQTWETTRSSIVIVWDEDDYAGISGCCASPTGVDGVVLGGARVPAIVLSSDGGGRTRWDGPANHYTLLATIEHLWGLGCLGQACDVGPRSLLTPLFDG
jgi:hypothetical protein